jgi:outer membrane lipoprotein carrier protein
MKKLLIFIIFGLSVYSSLTAANETLDRFFQQTNSMSASFEQRIYNSKGQLTEQSTGELSFRRPDRFYLDYQAPAEQKYISNGNTLWIYDVELEQVSLKAVNEGLGDSPALLLSSNTNVYKHYAVENVNIQDDRESQQFKWLQLFAKASETTFEKVLLGFDAENRLMQMEMHDNFGQITELKFANIQVNQINDDSMFQFVPPEGVDVIGTVNE